jgi:hypothetical protein
VLEVMGQLGMDALLGRTATDEAFLDKLCTYLMQRDKDGLLKFLRYTARIDLSDKELDYLLKERKPDICQCLRELSKCLEIKYDPSTDPKDTDPKRH